MNLTDFCIRLGAAFLLGIMIGLERQWRQKNAGLRTNTLVSVGSAAFILLSVSLTGNGGDPSRVAGQIVTGIGFLGAGVIMKDGLSVRGLNTAATIWCSAAVGAMAGVGLMIESLLITAVVLLTHLLLRPIAVRMSRASFKAEGESGFFTYRISVRCEWQVESQIRATIVRMLANHLRLKVHSIKSGDGLQESVGIEAEITASGNHNADMEALAGALTQEEGVIEVSWLVMEQQQD